MISYRVGNQLDLDEMILLYEASTLGERRPIADRERNALGSNIAFAFTKLIDVGVSLQIERRRRLKIPEKHFRNP